MSFLFKSFLGQFIRLTQVRYQNKTCKIYRGVEVDNRSSLGKCVALFQDVLICDSVINDYSYVQSNSKLFNCSIGKFCSIGSNVVVGLADHPIDMISTNPTFYDITQNLPKIFAKKSIDFRPIKKTKIESDVWIGHGALIKSGISIGVGAVIGAGAVVSSNVPPYSIVGGVPARHIKFRFSEDVCQRLLESKWWELDEARLKILCESFSQPLDFLNKCDKHI